MEYFQVSYTQTPEREAHVRNSQKKSVLLFFISLGLNLGNLVYAKDFLGLFLSILDPDNRELFQAANESQWPWSLYVLVRWLTLTSLGLISEAQTEQRRKELEDREWCYTRILMAHLTSIDLVTELKLSKEREEGWKAGGIMIHLCL